MEVLDCYKRLDYGESLMPDDGWETSWAIGTTYSLELEMLMSIPLALFHAKYLTESTTERDLCTDMLDALDKVRERMFVFVHQNNITTKSQYSILMGFLDQNIWNIPVDSPYKNFHPKVWLIRYTKKTRDPQSENKDYKYRLITTSRNITSATDFDIAVAMDSYKTDDENADNKSLVTMMKSLMKKTGRNDIIKQLEKELKYIRFIPPYPFNKKAKTAIFWPHTYKNLKSPLLEEKEYEELLVISPFIDDQTLEMLQKRCAQRPPILISREYEMDKCKPETLSRWDCYKWNSMLEEAGDYEEDEIGNNDSISHSISLHAKIFIAKASFGQDWNKYNNWFIGSTNCTHAGLHSNFEAQVQLRSLEPGTSVNEVLATLKDSGAPLITPYEIKKQHENDEEFERMRQTQRKLLYEFSQLGFKGSIEKRDDGKYITSINTDHTKWSSFWKKFSDVKITLKLFSSDINEWDFKTKFQHQFTGQLCQQLSSFLRVSIVLDKDNEKNFLLQVPIEIPEERQGRIMSEILDSEEKWLRYLMFCLDSQMAREEQNIGKDLTNPHVGGNDDTVWQRCSLPIYEKLLLASSRDRMALKKIQHIVEKLSKAEGQAEKPLLSDEFINMWKLFSKYSK